MKPIFCIIFCLTTAATLISFARGTSSSSNGGSNWSDLDIVIEANTETPGHYGDQPEQSVTSSRHSYQISSDNNRNNRQRESSFRKRNEDVIDQNERRRAQNRRRNDEDRRRNYSNQRQHSRQHNQRQHSRQQNQRQQTDYRNQRQESRQHNRRQESRQLNQRQESSQLNQRQESRQVNQQEQSRQLNQRQKADYRNQRQQSRQQNENRRQLFRKSRRNDYVASVPERKREEESATSLSRWTNQYGEITHVPFGKSYPEGKNEFDKEAAGPITAPILKNGQNFRRITYISNNNIEFSDEEMKKTRRQGKVSYEDHYLTMMCGLKLKHLAQLVGREWPGLLLHVKEAWDQFGDHGEKSLHYEGRAVDVTTSDPVWSSLDRIGGLAIRAGFEYVRHSSRGHLHLACKRQWSDSAY